MVITNGGTSVIRLNIVMPVMLPTTKCFISRSRIKSLVVCILLLAIFVSIGNYNVIFLLHPSLQIS
ncbi:hypothetical protein, partial [Escherichia coli]|uniref:hypothetical protein n=1 Tax=Escherichia coli TaxID=562 RepID=UPI003B97F0AB